MTSKPNNQGRNNPQCLIGSTSHLGPIINTYDKYYRLIRGLQFFKWVEQTQRFTSIAIMNEVWKYHLKKKSGRDSFQTICEKLIGLTRFGEYLNSSKGLSEFHEAYDFIVQFIDEAEDEFYSGYFGYVRRLLYRPSKPLHTTKKYKLL